MSITAKDIVKMIIDLTEQVNKIEAELGDAIDSIATLTSAFDLLHDRVVAVEQPKTIEKTGDAKVDAVIDQVNAWLKQKDEEDREIHKLVFDMKDQIGELVSAHHVRESRLGTPVDLNSLREIAAQSERASLGLSSCNL